MAGMRRSIVLLLFALAPTASFAQSTQPPNIVLPTIIVKAEKEASDIKEVPASVTAVTAATIESSGLRAITDAAIFAPNTVFTEFTARKVSNARFRGIGSSPGNPAITTYLDGVPQLNSNGYKVRYHEFDEPHTVPPEIAEEGIGWIAGDAPAP